MPTKLEPVVTLLAWLLVFFTVAAFAAEWLFRSDGAFFQSVTACQNGVLGALLGLITGHRIGINEMKTQISTTSAAKIEDAPPAEPQA